MPSERSFEGFTNESETERSPEALKENVEQMLLTCERVGEGGKAVVLRLAVDEASSEFRPALDALKINPSEEDKAIKLFKLYLPHKGAFEYQMQQKAYEAVQGVPSDQREKFASVPALSSMLDITLDDEAKKEIERQFSVLIAGNETSLIAMEYINGEDLGSLFYRWILERENAFSAEETDKMTFTQLYQEVSERLGYEVVSTEIVDDPRALELAEWKTSANNTKKLYEYLQKHRFPFDPEIAERVENSLKLFHKQHITHGDAFERNIMVTGGMRALRSRGSLKGETTYIIDFGEAKDHFVEGVDEFAVVRRLKKLGRTKEDEQKMESEKRVQEMGTKRNALWLRDKNWGRLSQKLKELSNEDSGKALNFAWNMTAGMDGGWVDRFFFLIKNEVQEGRFSLDQVNLFLTQKNQNLAQYQKRAIEDGLIWLGEPEETKLSA